MDRKSILAVIICFVGIFVLSKGVDKLFPPKPVPQAPVAAQPAQAAQAATSAPVAAPPTLAPVTEPMVAFTGDVPEQTIVLTNENARYVFTSHGGGMQVVELTKYPADVSYRSKQKQLESGLVELNTHTTPPALAVLGGEAVQGDGIFNLTRTATGVRAEKTLTNGLRIVKNFEPGSNYLVHTSVRFENTSPEPLTLPPQEWVVGAATPTASDLKGMAVGVMWYDGAKKRETFLPWFANKGFMCTRSLPRTEYRDGASNVVWAAAENQFFVIVAMPSEPAMQVVTRPFELPRSTEGPASVANNPPQEGCQTALVYPAFTLAPGQSLERTNVFFTGPKEYRTLARIANHYQNNVDLVMNFGWFGFVAKALLLAMNGLHGVLKVQYGLAIIVLTVILKILFWPLTTASMRTAKRMAALQPQMKVLQEKYKDDPLKMQKKMGEFWKEHKVHPLNGCLPMMVQIPVFIGFYTMIRTAIELRGAHFLWIPDLSCPDTMYTIPSLGFLPFIGIPGVGLPLNPLPILYIITALWQSHLTPPSPGMDPAQQRLMRWLPLMFLVILYNFSSGLALYMTVQNLLTILQTKLIQSREAAHAPAPAPVLTHPPKKHK